MGKLTRKYVESIEECKYIERGTSCGVCGKKLGFFYDDFWSVNSRDRHLIDGVLCGKCHKHFNTLIQDKKWVSNEVRKQPQWKKFTSLISESYTAEDIKWFFEQKENSDKENLSAYGSEACGLFRIKCLGLVIMDAFCCAGLPHRINTSGLSCPARTRIAASVNSCHPISLCENALCARTVRTVLSRRTPCLAHFVRHPLLGILHPRSSWSS